MNPGGIISTVSIIDELLIFDLIISAISTGFFFNSFDSVSAILVDQFPKDLFFGFSIIIFFESNLGKLLFFLILQWRLLLFLKFYL